MSTPSLARRERRALCDTALALGEDAPTLCEGWDAKDLVTHLLVRENRPLGALGIAVPRLEGLAEHEMAKVGRADFAALVEKLRHPRLTPYALPPVDRLLNTLEYFVHHEDLRRAQPGWEARELDQRDQSRLWSAIKVAGRGLVRPAGVPVQLRRTDTGATAVLRRGDDPVVVTGLPSEIVLLLFGRDRVAEVRLDGTAERVARLRRADLGI
ncbi:TIGR03085 family metal-binding protein [Nocardioides sp. MAHUQ-72]|uniref:TIGR03085 family metal-binding protein n=1 Tax=unclassified Nocardioides TaxID=2615069 RepID=UPI003615EA1B